MAVLMWIAWPGVGALIGCISYARLENPLLSLLALAGALINVGALLASAWLLWLIKAVWRKNHTRSSRNTFDLTMAGLLVVPAASLIGGVALMFMGNPLVLEYSLGGALIAFGTLSMISVIYHIMAAHLFVNSIATNMRS